MDTFLIVLYTLLGLTVVKLAITFILGGNSFARLGLAIRAYLTVLRDPEVARNVKPLLTTALPEPAKPAKLSGEPLRLLTLLQREGRLLDFLLEDIATATDDQVGAGVRELHKKSQAILKEHLTMEPIVPGQEEATVEVPAGFDPSAIRLTGNVTGQPPFKGILKHHGWRVKNYKLPAPPPGIDELVVAPAEVELP
jgi:hypothetical protein